MPGQITKMIDTIITKRSNGNATIAATTRTKLMLKGVHPDKYNADSPDDAAVMDRLRALATEMGISL